MWNRHTKVPKIAPAHLFSISGMNFSVVAVSYKVNTNIFKFSLILKCAGMPAQKGIYSHPFLYFTFMLHFVALLWRIARSREKSWLNRTKA